MQKVTQFLLFASRGLAICAVLAGIGVGFLEASFGAAFVCFDSCPTREEMFPNIGPGAVLQPLLPCVVLELLAQLWLAALANNLGHAVYVLWSVMHIGRWGRRREDLINLISFFAPFVELLF